MEVGCVAAGPSDSAQLLNASGKGVIKVQAMADCREIDELYEQVRKGRVCLEFYRSEKEKVGRAPVRR